MSENFGMKGYMKGALLLTIAAIIVKVLSAIYRVPFQNLVGDEGFYIYQQVYPFISFFVVWTSGGFAVAISKMLADAQLSEHSLEQKNSISQTIFHYLIFLSIVFFCILFFGSNFLANMMGDIGLAPLLRTGAFITLVMPFLAIMKGTFQSTGNMKPVAYAQVFEQFTRVVIILVGSFIIMTTTESLYASGNVAVLGTIIGEVAGVVLLLYFTKKSNGVWKVKRKAIHKWTIIKKVTVLSLSVSMSSLLLLSFQLIDSFTVFSLLVESGMDEQVAKETKGIYDRGQPLVQMGIVIASSLSLAIVPLIAYQSNKKKGRSTHPFVQVTYRTSVLFGVAASLGLIVVMPYVNQMLFETDALSNVLKVSVLQIIPLSIILTFTAILQGMDKLKIPFVILFGAIMVKYFGNIYLIPRFEVMGSAMTSTVALSLCATLLVVYLKYLEKVKLAKVSFYIKLFVASFSMVLAVLIADHLFQMIKGSLHSERIESVIVGGSLIVIGAFIFITVVAKTKILAEKEWFLIPFGRRMAAFQLLLNKKK